MFPSQNYGMYNNDPDLSDYPDRNMPRRALSEEYLHSLTYQNQRSYYRSSSSNDYPANCGYPTSVPELPINPHFNSRFPQTQWPVVPSFPSTARHALLAPQQFQNVQQRNVHEDNNTTANVVCEQVEEAAEIMKVLSKRYWQYEEMARPSKTGLAFTVMSYNVLAQDLITEHPYLYRHHCRKALQWELRWKNVLNEIKTLHPDILCLQEVQASHIDGYFKVLESLGYTGIYKKRTGLRCDGCAIYYKVDKLQLIEYETVEFYQPNVPVLNRDNIAVIARFCPAKNPKSQFIVATTHLLYNPKRDDVRLAQTQLLLTEVERMSFRWNSKGNPRYWPLIITGDFNSTPESIVYQLITRGSVKYDHLTTGRSQHRQEQSSKESTVLVPSDLEITDKCQHAVLLHKRRNDLDLSRKEEAALIKLHNSEKAVTKVKTDIMKDQKLFSSGTLRHLFAFKSVYDHGTRQNPEGTTFQDEWTTVDYIFYSGKKQENVVQDYKLKLLSRYRLPLKNELGTTKIPNSLMGSDHLCLVATFQLSF